MSFFSSLNSWATGDGHFHNLVDCLGGDWITALLVVILSVLNALGYIIIATGWHRISLQLRDKKARRTFNTFMYIFLYCAICGYLWHPIQYYWPGWRFYLIPLSALVFFTWRFILDPHSLENVKHYFLEKEHLADRVRELKKELESHE